jgi:hypothetical protein
MNRRSFLQNTALGAAGLVVLRNARSAWGAEASSKLNLAHVGCGGRGRELIYSAFSKSENIVAMCDVNESKATEMYRKFPDVAKFQDFREMIDKKGKEIDAVVVATPDHTHAVASAYAIRAGKHVYTEKPLTRLVFESRALRELARKHKVATSMGNQGTASGQFRRGVELIRDGTLGEIKEAHVWNCGGGANHPEAPKEEAKIPPYLNWDLWLGPARSRPFNPKWLWWGSWRDFGTNQLGNWGSHSANLAFMALKVHELWLAEPSASLGPGPAKEPHPVLRVEAKTSNLNRLSFPKWEQIRYEVPARAEFPPIVITWHNGRDIPGSREMLEKFAGIELDWGDKGDKKYKHHGGAVIVGAKGTIRATEHNQAIALVPEEAFKDVKKDAPEKLDPSQGHERDWLAACRGGKPAWANFDYASALNEFLQLGNVATQFEGKLEYDPVAMKIVNNAEADAALRCEYRQGWAL